MPLPIKLTGNEVGKNVVDTDMNAASLAKWQGWKIHIGTGSYERLSVIRTE